MWECFLCSRLQRSAQINVRINHLNSSNQRRRSFPTSTRHVFLPRLPSSSCLLSKTRGGKKKAAEWETGRKRGVKRRTLGLYRRWRAPGAPWLQRRRLRWRRRPRWGSGRRPRPCADPGRCSTAPGGRSAGGRRPDGSGASSRCRRCGGRAARPSPDQEEEENSIKNGKNYSDWEHTALVRAAACSCCSLRWRLRAANHPKKNNETINLMSQHKLTRPNTKHHKVQPSKLRLEMLKIIK